MAAPAAEWALLGWFGVRAEVPPAWNLAAARGDRKRGSLRLEDEDVVRAEIAWQPVHRKRTLQQIADQVTRRLERTARKRRESVEVAPVSDLKLNRRAYRLFRCQTQAGRRSVLSLNLVYRCETCRRAVVATVFYRPSERKRLTAAARHLFDTLADHPADERDVWSAYGFRLEVPSDYDLAKSALRVGLVDLTFVRRDWQIDFLRSALAEVQVRRQGLAQWFAGAYARHLRQYTTTTERTEFRGHAAVAVEGRSKMGKVLLRPLRPRHRVHCLAWHCQVSDKLFIFRMSGPRELREEFDQLLETVACH